MLSLPYLGFLDKTHPTYTKTRKVLLSRNNPYYAAGKNFSGIGYGIKTHFEVSADLHFLSSGPHVDAYHPWPMSQISAVFGTDDDGEILNSLYLIANVSALNTCTARMDTDH